MNKNNPTYSPMSLSQLNHILHSKMKLGKSCEFYRLTVEHLWNYGSQAKQLLLDLINRTYSISPVLK